LEIGCGPGIDLVRFARAGPEILGIDISTRSVQLARRWISFNQVAVQVDVVDAESLPFRSGEFEFVYSWVVLHHPPDIKQAVREIYRVLKPAARFCVMLYHKASVVALQAWLVHGLLAVRPWRSIDDILGKHLESPGTKAFSRQEIRELFSDFIGLTIKTVEPPYDVRLGRRLFLRDWVQRLVPRKRGWFLVVQGTIG